MTRRDHESDTRPVRADGDIPRFGYVALLACNLLVAVVTFTLSFHGLDDYGNRVAGLGHLSPLVPLGVDGLTLTAIAATFLLAGAPLRVRAYAWLVFTIANGASVAGNVSHAVSRNLAWDGMVGAAAWPLFLTLASHLVIVSRRNLRRRALQTAPPVARPVAPSHASAAVATREPISVATTPPTSPPPVLRRATPNAPASRRKHPKAIGDNDLARQRGRDMFRRGSTPEQIATASGVSLRTAQRWIKDLRGTSDVAPAATSEVDDIPLDRDRELVAVG